MSEEKLLYTIGEVAEKLHLEQHVLRFWESQFNHIKPIKCKRRRLYDEKCIETIKRIKYMLYNKGYTIKGVKREFNNAVKTSNNVENMLQKITELRDYLIDRINKEENDSFS